MSAGGVMGDPLAFTRRPRDAAIKALSGLGDDNLNSEDPLSSLLDFTPRAIGTEDDPLKSVDGTRALLHIVCLILPQANGSIQSQSQQKSFSPM